MQRQTDDVRILEIKELLPPIAHLYELPITDTASELIYATRSDIARMLRGEDDRLLVVIGPAPSTTLSWRLITPTNSNPCAKPMRASYWW